MSTRLKALEQPRVRDLDPPPLPVVNAIKAMWSGTGTEPHQQRMVLQWIIHKAGFKDCQTAYYESDRDTAFALGRIFVADALLGLIKAETRSGNG